ncbi:MAG TPA: hypothetical protein ENK66_03710 [Arcobacter sp.]|jgi:CRISPR/Cas system CSM-associated protein Csm3 (group 7 of RAMP superfamily)|nr:hypothetical protein [Arcobacter sp.]
MSKSDEISNFIDKSDKVFLFSDEDSNISLDIPFANSCSGSIVVDIKAKSPIFIRNHYVQGDDSYTVEKDGVLQTISTNFCHHKNNRYIPATSVKGMVRNTLEIMSYAKLGGKTLDAYLTAKVSEDNPHRSEVLDLSEAIFGTTELKGRVQFSHFKEIGKSNEMTLQSEILGTPEAKKKKFGWKNYPILKNTKAGKGAKSDKVKSKFRPLASGAKFQGVLRFHNLRDFELGAILSALTFHDTPDAHHNIGLGKALGYGAIKIEFHYDNQVKYLQAFEEKMNAEIFDGKMLWHSSAYIKELIHKHSDSQVGCSSYSSLEGLQQLTAKKRKEMEKNENQEKNKILNKDNTIGEIPELRSKKFKKAIEDYVVTHITLPYYDYKHLKLLFEGKEEDIIDDDIYNAYIALTEEISFKYIEPLLIKREKNTIMDTEVIELYKLLFNSKK